MSDTPRTDRFEEAYFEDSTSHVDDVFEYCRTLERENAALLKRLEASDGWDDYNAIKALKAENAALRADKERLDWLLTFNGSTWLYWAIERGQWTPEQGASRAAIDAARKEQP